MIAFLKTPAGILTILTITISSAIGIANWVHPFSTERRALAVAITQNLELTSHQDFSRNGQLEFIFNGEKVPNLISTKIRFWNSGTMPIQETDFREGINIYFPPDIRVVSTALVQSQPLHEYEDSQQVFVRQTSPNTLEFKPLLLNPGDIFDLDVLTARDGAETSPTYLKDAIKFDYTIFGIGKITTVSKIETAFEKKNTAISNVSVGLRNLYAAAMTIGVLFIFLMIMIAIANWTRKNITNSTMIQIGLFINKYVAVLILACFFVFMAILLIQQGVTIIYDAYFIEI